MANDKKAEADVAEQTEAKANDTKAADTKAADTKAFDAKVAAAVENATAAAIEKANAAAAARIAELEAQLASSGKGRAKARATTPGEVRVVVKDGAVQGRNHEKTSADDGLPTHRVYGVGKEFSMPLAEAEQLSELGYVTIID